MVSTVVTSAVSLVGNVLHKVTPSILHPHSGTTRDESIQFLDDLRDRNEHCPNFYRGTFKEALRQAQRDRKLIFIYLHSHFHGDTPSFEREILDNEHISDILNVNYISWAGDIRHSDAYGLVSTLGVETFPFIALMVPPQLPPLFKHEGVPNPDVLLGTLVSSMEEYARAIEAATVQHVQRTVQRTEARSIREEQDDEYQRAVMEHEEQKRREEEERRAAEEAKRQEEEERRREEEERLEKEREREEKLNALDDEPEEGLNVTKVAIMLPNNTRVERRFLSSAPIGEVRSYLETMELVDQEGDEVREFTLVTRFPRKELDDMNITLSGAGLGKQCLLIVEPEYDEESSEEEESD